MSGIWYMAVHAAADIQYPQRTEQRAESREQRHWPWSGEYNFYFYRPLAEYRDRDAICNWESLGARRGHCGLWDVGHPALNKVFAVLNHISKRSPSFDCRLSTDLLMRRGHFWSLAI
jgi:hypothetical protein